MFEMQRHTYITGEQALNRYRVRLVEAHADDSADEGYADDKTHIDILAIVRYKVDSEFMLRQVRESTAYFFYQRFGIDLTKCTADMDPVVLHWYPADEVQAALAYFKMREAGIAEYREENAWGL